MMLRQLNQTTKQAGLFNKGVVAATKNRSLGPVALTQRYKSDSSKDGHIAAAASRSAAKSTTGQVKRESLRSKLATIFGGKVDPADPNEPPISADDLRFPDVTDRATGDEKLVLLAFENGILDPYCNLPTERNGRGSKDNPVIVESFDAELIIACACESNQNHFKYTTLHYGEPKRCQCGHWIKMVEAPRFWEKIPKEDLLEIPKFKQLEDEGKLDKYLQTGRLDEDHHHDHGSHH